jgi:hypothetical protein
MPLSLDKEITFLRSIPGFGQYLSEGLRKIQEGVNNLGQNIAADPSITLPAPPTIQGLTVKTNGQGMVHAVINDSNAIQKNVHYFIHISTDPSFLQPQVIHLGVSRTMTPIMLPANDDNGHPQSFYFRAFSQTPGSLPSAPVHFGGTIPTAVNPGGTQNLTLIPSTGSGTGQPNGQSGPVGFGTTTFRPAQGPKRRSTS